VSGLQLVEGGQQLVARVRAECRRLPFQDDRPIREARWHMWMFSGQLRQVARRRVRGHSRRRSGRRKPGVQPFQLLDERGAFQLEELRCLSLVPLGALE